MPDHVSSELCLRGCAGFPSYLSFRPDTFHSPHSKFIHSFEVVQMVRTHSNSKQESRPSRAGVPSVTRTRNGGSFGTWWDELLVRLTFSSACVAASYHFHPFGLQPAAAAVVGLLFSCAVFLFEIRLRRATLRRLIGAVVGLILGILAGYLAGLVVARSSIPAGSRSFMDVALLLVMSYIGLAVGAHKGELLNLQAL